MDEFNAVSRCRMSTKQVLNTTERKCCASHSCKKKSACSSERKTEIRTEITQRNSEKSRRTYRLVQFTCHSGKENGDLRLCIDPKEPVDQERALQTANQVRHNQCKGRSSFFSKMDVSSGFYQIKLDEESAKLCTFNSLADTDSLACPLGSHLHPKSFTELCNNCSVGSKGVGVFLGDVVVWGTTRKEHDERLRKVMEKVRESGLKLNKQKCQFGPSEITDSGDKLSATGIQPPKKVRAITHMQPPKDKVHFQRARGLVNYVGRLVPNLSAKTKALGSLLEDRTEWQWEHHHAAE